MIDPDEDCEPENGLAHDEDVPVGRCCACGEDGRRLPNIVQLHKRMPVPGKGWGCFVCGLPQAGAVAAVCDVCMPPSFEYGDKLPELRFVCAGYAGEPERLPIDSLTEPFEHIEIRHEVYEATMLPPEALYQMGIDDDADEDDPPAPFICSRCRQPIWMPENPPILAWPIGPDGEPLSDPDTPGDIQMLRLCDKCANSVIAPNSGGPE